MKELEIIHSRFEVAVIGAGGAGLMAAVEAAKKGMDVLCISKVHPSQSHTVAAQGGINAALGNMGEDDWRFHSYDTIKSGQGLADHDVVEKMCKMAPDIIRKLENYGLPFTRTKDGKIYQRPYGGQTLNYGKGDLAKRACAVADRTGQSIIHTLYQQALKFKVKFLLENFLVDFLENSEGKISGILLWDIANGLLRIIHTKAIIIATGGFGYLYDITTSSSICTGEVQACLLKHNIPLMDMEFVQFHPTGLYQNGLLVTEAARAEGGILLNNLGERFMERYEPKLKELACRDVIARAILQEIKEGRGCGKNKDYIELDLTHLQRKEIQEKLPLVYETITTFAGIDPAKQKIAILPSLHYTMGGIPVNQDARVSFKRGLKLETPAGLYAIGEAACGSVHGANRLGCNSLLEILVFGQDVVNSLSQDIKHLSFSELESKAPLAEFYKIYQKENNSKSLLPALQKKLAKCMSEYAGIYRDADQLKFLVKKISEIELELNGFGNNNLDLRYNDSLLNYYELKGLLLLAKSIAYSALARKESRGAHYRQDYPVPDQKKFRKHSLFFLQNLLVNYQKIRE